MRTNETLKELSEHEINVLVAEIKGQHYTERELSSNGHKWLDGEHDVELNYCQNPEDIMPIVIENGINHAQQMGLNSWKAYKPRQISRWHWREIKATNKNLLRAYCECYILCNQGDV